MYTYTMTQWLAFLLIYSFLGWIWECCYVSVRQKKWVNRGFMHGPLLPIYGSGAVIVLFAALPFKGNVPAVYVAGMIAATILEYVTGAAMEAIFKVRYWDYSKNKFNLHGHICLFCSLGWGFFSIAMVYVLHKPVEHLVLWVPEEILSAVVMVCMMIASADYAISFKTAIELRGVLEKLEQAKKEVQILQKRIEVCEAFLADDLSNRVEKLEEGKEKMRTQIQEEREELQKKLSGLRERIEERRYMKPDFTKLLERNPGAVSVKYKAAFAEVKNSFREKMDDMKEKAGEVKQKAEEVKKFYL